MAGLAQVYRNDLSVQGVCFAYRELLYLEGEYMAAAARRFFLMELATYT